MTNKSKKLTGQALRKAEDRIKDLKRPRSKNPFKPAPHFLNKANA